MNHAQESLFNENGQDMIDIELSRHEAIEERAGILEFEAGLPRAEAERQALRMHGTRVVVFGGRDYSDANYLWAALDRLHAQYRFGLVIEGGARGADQLARHWARQRRVAFVTENADWDRHKNAAGPIRNRKMLEHRPELAVGFPGGPGTADMTNVVTEAGIPLVQP